MLPLIDQACRNYQLLSTFVLPSSAGGLASGSKFDARAFLLLREGLANHGVTLLDAIVCHEDHRWWSLNELTSGTTQWSFADRSRCT